ncbi:ABC transporter permease [Vibrio fluminensis]|uniref:ABC transporter permease n=1 Tax=Vibrio fluminensis TaxID=2783614 RepID=UPI0018878E36|nr:FtsX-like permease family protein [Vibrio fluminensis]
MKWNNAVIPALSHTILALRIFVAHYRQAPLQAAAILIGIVLAVSLFVAVQAINLNAKRSYSDASEPLSTQAKQLIIPPSGQRYLSESLYFSLRQHGFANIVPLIDGRVRDDNGRRWSIQGIDVIAAITARQRAEKDHSSSAQTKGNSSNNASLSSTELPLAELISGEPVLMMSQTQHQSIKQVRYLMLDKVRIKVVALPDGWQLGNRVLVDIGFAQQLLGQSGKLSYIAILENTSEQALMENVVGDLGQITINQQDSQLDSLTDSFHLNLTAMSLLAFLVGLFITYNGVKYSLLKRNRLLVQIQQMGVAQRYVLSALVVELAILVSCGTTLGFVLGIQLSHWLHPTVALTLEQLYGATILPNSWQWQWWLQALLLTLAATILASWQHLRQRIRQPLSSHGGFYHAPVTANNSLLFIVAVTLTLFALLGLLISDHHRITMAWLGVLIIAVPLYLPKTLSVLAGWSEQQTPNGLLLYLLAELKELIAPLSLAMMALLLAVTANIGINTLVGSFEYTLKQWLDQRLHADIYISPAQNEMAEIEQALDQMDSVDKVYRQFYVDDQLLGLPILLGTKDRDTLEQTMVFKSHIDNFWPLFFAGKVVAISEPTAVKLGLSLNSQVELEALPKQTLIVGAVFHDYGSPNGEVLIAPQLWQQNGFTRLPTSLGVKAASDPQSLYQQLIARFKLHPSQVYDQADIKAIALEIFSQTFAITRALNSVTLLVAVIGLFCSCFMLLDARKAAIARLYALGVNQQKLMLMVIGQMVVLVVFTLSMALPLGALVGFVLTDIVTLRAFGWSLEFVWHWQDALTIAGITLIVAIIATLIPLWRLVRRPILASLQNEVL